MNNTVYEIVIEHDGQVLQTVDCCINITEAREQKRFFQKVYGPVVHILKSTLNVKEGFLLDHEVH